MPALIGPLAPLTKPNLSIVLRQMAPWAALCVALAADPAWAAAMRDDAVGGAVGGGASAEAAGPASDLPLRTRHDEDKIDFAADQVDYDDTNDVVMATGNVFLRRGEQTVRANTVRWNRKTGQIMAQGQLRVVDANGNELLTDQMELSEDLSVGLTHNMLMLMREGGRLAANEGRRDSNGHFVLTQAAYTGCDVVDSKGCEKKPIWKVTARHVEYDPDKKIVRFKGARLSLFGASIMPLPSLQVATDGRPLPGFLVPDFRTSAANGFEFSSTYYARLANNKDLAITGYAFTKANPMAKVHYRQLGDTGAFQITGYLTRSAATDVSGLTTQQKWRGYFDANGKYQLSENWSLDFSGRFASDRTFLRRYYISSDDTLRSNINLERIGQTSYFSLSGWAFQTLRATGTQGQVPLAVPMIDYRRRFNENVLGGKIELRVNTLAITRSAGQDMQRAFASAEWNLRKMTPMGQIITLTALGRGDVYHSSDNLLTSTAIYRGTAGWQGRATATAAVDITWPLVGPLFGGTQVLTPHVQVVAAPPTRNMAIPNEDARAIELEDVNLFALNRFPGYDRIEDGNRVTYGMEWRLERPSWRINANVGQSYRLSSEPTLLPQGTGLSDRMSDIVGRTEIRYRDFFKITHRYRLDHDSFVFRRNEVDAALGSDTTYLEVGYARLNRNITTSQEDLVDSNELRTAGRIAFAKFWSVFGSGVFDLSDKSLLANTSTASFQPLRTRLGVSFQTDCFQFDLNWRRDYVTIGDAVRGSSFELRFSLRNLGFR